MKLVIIGMGYIGVPTAVMFAKAGYEVVGIERNKEKVDTINKGQCYIEEKLLPEMLKEVVASKKLRASTDYSECKTADGIIVCVETPLSKECEPDYIALKAVMNGLAPNMKKGTILMIESTLAPTTSERLIIPTIEKLSGLKAGEDFLFAVCSETIIPGNMMKEIVENSRVIGGINEKSSEAVKKIYSSFVKGKIYLTNSTTAEFAKVVQNTYRDVNIALANEIALMCDQLGIDVNEAIKLVNMHPRVNLHSPGAGVGGHCIPKDPYLLAYGIKGNMASEFIKIARKLNRYMPEYMVSLAEKHLRECGKTLANSSILILGATYKKDTDDLRDTPTSYVVEFLRKKGVKKIEVVDPHMPILGEELGFEVIKEMNKISSGFDCVLLVTDHTEFLQMNLKELKKKCSDKPILVDGRGVFDISKVKEAGFIFSGIGRDNVKQA